MRKLDRICVGTDFSRQAEIGLRSAARVARTFGAALDLLNVVEPVPFYRKVMNPIQSRLVPTEEVVARAGERLSELADDLRERGLHVESAVRVGSAFAELIAHCRERGAQLLVVGTRAGDSVQKMLLGSTAERVLRKAPVPVLVAKRLLAEKPEVILAPTDFSAAGRPAVDEAIALARRWGARLVLVHALEPIAEAYVWPVEPGPVPMYVIEPEELEPEWESFLATTDLRGVAWEKRTVKGYATTMISVLAGELGADLVVMGTHGRTGLAHALLGSVAERVTREAQCPVLSVRPEAHEFVLP